MKTQTISINPYSANDPRWKWFGLGVLSVQHPDFIERIGTLPQKGSPNLEAFHEGIKREKELN